jgi:hypothetical protein
MDLTATLIAVLQETAQQLPGRARRLCRARIVRELGVGGQQRAEGVLGGNRVTIRKGPHERASGCTCHDAFALRGRKRAETHLPALLTDSTALVAGQSQTDPPFRTTRLSTRLTAAQVRQHLIAQQGDTDAALPTRQTIGAKRNARGDHLQQVVKTQPQKRFPRPTPSSPS